MVYNHENITVHVEHISSDWVEHIGETVLFLDSGFIAELIENHCTFSEFYVQYECEDLYNDLDCDDEALIKHFKELNETIEVRNTDAIVAVYEYALDYPDRCFTFDVQTENISWVIHDILHAIHDTAGCTIYVQADIEKQRILKSLEITQKEFPNYMPDWSFLDNLEAEFHARFKQSICLDEFKEMEDDY